MIVFLRCRTERVPTELIDEVRRFLSDSGVQPLALDAGGGPLSRRSIRYMGEGSGARACGEHTIEVQQEPGPSEPASLPVLGPFPGASSQRPQLLDSALRPVPLQAVVVAGD